VYLPETYVLPQALGGIVFGAGFLVAGLCPGTSCVAAATGRRDGLGVMAGMPLGVLIFNIGFPWIASVYSATPLGAVRLTDLAGTTVGVGIAAVTAVALVGFIATRMVERTVTSHGTRHAALAMAAVVLSGGAALVDQGTGEFISAPDLADRIIQRSADQRIFDLRPQRAFEQFHIPSASQITVDDLARTSIAPHTSVVLYGDARRTVSAAVRVLQTRGHRDVRVLREGMHEWLARVHEPRLAVDATPAERAEFERAAALSRFFGGVPLSGVPRDDVPKGYWNGHSRNEALLVAAAVESIGAIRRRGC
jgi:rhodanese-related sulfurtransferase